jgi:hypothetical protein
MGPNTAIDRLRRNGPSNWLLASSSGIRFRELKAFLVNYAERVKHHAVELARHQKRPFQYLQEKVRKEELAREIAARDQIEEGVYVNGHERLARKLKQNGLGLQERQRSPTPPCAR